MKILKYHNFLNEKYSEDPEYRIKVFFDELEKNIKYWFTEGSFAANETELYDIKKATSNNVEKSLIFDFQDNEYYYQIIVISTLEEVDEDLLDECFIKVKKYDIDSSELLREIGEDVKIKELNEDKIFELIAKLDEKSDSILGEDENDETLSDEDSELDDTNLF